MKPSDNHADLIEIKCTFSERLYRSDDAQYCVGMYIMADGRDISCVGSDLPELGYAVTFSGKWATHPKYGTQFKVEMVVDMLPHNEQDTIHFIMAMVSKISRKEVLMMLQNLKIPSFFPLYSSSFHSFTMM